MPHTPGPWLASDDAVFAEDEKGTVIAHIPSTSTIHADNPEANARLIAAAPELLEALQEATEYLVTHLPKGNIRDSAHFHALNEHACLVKQTRTAINKALGTEE